MRDAHPRRAFRASTPPKPVLASAGRGCASLHVGSAHAAGSWEGSQGSQEIVNRLNSELNRAFSAPEVAERLAQLGLDWKSNTPGELAAFLREEVQKWSRAVKESGARAD